MINQFYTVCRSCGKQILMTRCETDGRWRPCHPVVMRFAQAGGPYSYINTDGEFKRGYPDENGEIGYSLHRRFCWR